MTHDAQIVVLKNELSSAGCIVHEPGSRGYAQATRLWNGAVEREPALVTACTDANQVRTALLAARALEFRCRCAMAAATGLGEPCGTAASFLTWLLCGSAP